MILMTRLGVVLAGLSPLLMTLLVWINPEKPGEILGLSAMTSLGMNTLHTDFIIFFLSCAIAGSPALFAEQSNLIQTRLPQLMTFRLEEKSEYPEKVVR